MNERVPFRIVHIHTSKDEITGYAAMTSTALLGARKQIRKLEVHSLLKFLTLDGVSTNRGRDALYLSI